MNVLRRLKAFIVKVLNFIYVKCALSAQKFGNFECEYNVSEIKI